LETKTGQPLIHLGVLEEALNLARANSLWPLTFGLACCAIEMMAAGAARFDLDRHDTVAEFVLLPGGDHDQPVVDPHRSGMLSPGVGGAIDDAARAWPGIRQSVKVLSGVEPDAIPAQGLKLKDSEESHVGA